MPRADLRIAVLLALGILGACKREPSFDERYAGARKAISEKVGELDRDMARRSSEAASEAVVPEETGAAVSGET